MRNCVDNSIVNSAAIKNKQAAARLWKKQAAAELIYFIVNKTWNGATNMYNMSNACNMLNWKNNTAQNQEQ